MSVATPTAAVERSATCRTLVVTPVGVHGRGGIDRLNYYLTRFVDAQPEDAPARAVRFDFLASRGEGSGLVWFIHFVLALMRFAWRLVVHRPDTVHIHVSTDGSALRKVCFGKLARLFRVPFAIHFHGMISGEARHANPLWLRALRMLARDADRVIVLGHAFVEPFTAALGVARNRISIIHNGIPDLLSDADARKPVREERHILFCGEVGLRKGVDLLLDALAGLESEPRPWRCTIAGNGDLEPWRRKAEEAGISRRITFTGWIDAAGVHALARDADIVVLPSRAEALPLSLIEGASAGAALIATDVGAVRDVVRDGENGLVVDHDPPSIAAAIARLLNDDAMRKRMQARSRELYREKFAMARFVGDIVGEHMRLCR